MGGRKQQPSEVQAEVRSGDGEDGHDRPVVSPGVIVLALSIDRATGAVTPAGTIGVGGDEASDLLLCLDALEIIAQSMRRQLRAHVS